MMGALKSFIVWMGCREVISGDIAHKLLKMFKLVNL